MPPQVNATVTKVERRGAASGAGDDDWDRPAKDPPGDPDALKWAGSIRAYYHEKIDRQPAGAGAAGNDVLVRRTLIIDTADLDTLGVDTDDVITFTVDGKAQTTGTAALIPRAALAGIPRDLQTSRIELKPA